MPTKGRERFPNLTFNLTSKKREKIFPKHGLDIFWFGSNLKLVLLLIEILNKLSYILLREFTFESLLERMKSEGY